MKIQLNDKPQTFDLAEGLRVICAPANTDVVYCGIAVDAGTRDELDSESGMAHFTEHMSFKGTARRSSRQVINRLESIGGELNAFTGKEETVYYASVLSEHLPRAVDLLLDITMHSLYPQEEMDKEVEVVIDEIESYNDQPSELIYDEFEGICFAGHPLGRNILGQADVLHSIKSCDMQSFVQRLYQPQRMVFFAYGNVKAEQLVRLVEQSIHRYGLPQSDMKSLDRQQPRTNTIVEPVIVRKKETHQAHVMIGAPAFPIGDKRHLPMFLLNNMLGGPSMSSRLNLSLRERNGLVYTVESNVVSYTDAGMWATYFGCDPCDVNRCRRLVLRELKKLTDSPLSQRTLDAARRQLKGQIGISYDNFESVAIGMAKRYLHSGRTQTKQQVFEQLDNLTPQQLLDVAQEVFATDRLQTLIYR